MYLVMKDVPFECFQKNTILSIMMLCQGTTVGKMEHSHTDSSVLATQGLLSESKKDERGNQERDSISLSSEEHCLFLCSVVLMTADIGRETLKQVFILL